MNATRPRHSVLSLFDPLVDEQRDASSPDSDKENSASFFGRSFKPASPVVLKRRLVDVGDVTLDDASMLMMLTDEEELDDIEDDENDTLIFRVPTATPARSAPSPRTPLGEITLEDDTPVARSKVYKRPPPSSSLSSTNDSSISSVINAVNASGISFASPGPKSLPLTSYDLTYDHESLNATDTASQNPIITISSSDTLSNSLSTLNLNTPIGSLLTDMSRPFETTPPSVPSEGSSSHLLTRLRPNPPSTSSRDHNRHSIDLHSSFQLQLQSEESSFDLLNDKCSFFASTNGADSFLNAMEGDDSFDMAIEEANLENALEKLKLEDKAKGKQSPVVSWNLDLRRYRIYQGSRGPRKCVLFAFLLFPFSYIKRQRLKPKEKSLQHQRPVRLYPILCTYIFIITSSPRKFQTKPPQKALKFRFRTKFTSIFPIYIRTAQECRSDSSS